MSAVESWFTPAAAAAEALPKQRAQRRTSTRTRPKAKPRQWKTFRVRASLVFMVVFALLLVGVVAVNVAVLRAHVSVTDLDTKISNLQQGNASLASQLASMTSAPRVEAAARREGFVPAPGDAATLLVLGIGK